MKAPQSLPFLARPGYRRRRLIEAIRLLPYAGLLAFLFPLLWPESDSDVTRTSRGAIYLFTGWFLLILAAWLGTRALNRSDAREETHSDPQ